MSSKVTLLSGRVLLSIIALFTAVSPYVADWNATHIYNPSWPPHAKFHNGQTMAVAVLLGVSALFFIWDKRSKIRVNLPATLLLISFYWVSQALANLYPGVAWTDPNLLGAGESLTEFPTPQLILDAIMFALVALSAFLVLRGKYPGTNNLKYSLV